MHNKFHQDTLDLQQHVNKVSTLITSLTQTATNQNAIFGAINRELEQIDKIKTRIYDYIDKNLKTIETNPDYTKYNTIQKKFIEALSIYDIILSDTMPKHR